MEKQYPKISVVMPAYNAAKYIGTAINSFLKQDYKNKELIIVDDGSTDDTSSIIKDFVDNNSNIVCYNIVNSGSAKYPRDMAIVKSSGDLIIPLDADDILGEGYISHLYETMVNCNADIVFPKMLYFYNQDLDDIKKTLPESHIILNKGYKGRDLFIETIDGWKIGCNGGLYKRKIMSNLSYPQKQGGILMNGDEYDTRLYLLNAQCVAFSDAYYYYRNYTDSISKRVSVKLFQAIKTSVMLYELALGNFSADSLEVINAYQHMIRMRSFINIYIKNYFSFSKNERFEINSYFDIVKMKETYRDLNIKAHLNIIYNYIFTNKIIVPFLASLYIVCQNKSKRVSNE